MNTILHTFKRFFISGFGAALLNFLVFYILNSLFSINYITSSIFAFLTAFAFAFVLHRNWSFKNIDNINNHKSLFLYFLISLFNLGAILTGMHYLVSNLGLNSFLSYIFIASTVTIFSFILNNFFAFKENRFDDLDIWKMILSITLLAICIYFTRNFFLDPKISGDTLSLIEAGKFYSGEIENGPGHRLLKPIVPLILSWLHLIFNISYDQAFTIFIFASFILYSWSAIFISYIVSDKNKLHTYLGAILLITSYPIIKYGLDPMTETAALFFVFTSVGFSILYYKYDNFRDLLLSILLTLIGFWVKEYTIISGLLIFIIVLNKFWNNKLKYFTDLFLVTFIPSLFLISWFLYTKYIYNYTYFDWLKVGQQDVEAYTQFTFYHISKSLFATYMFAWVLAFCGLFRLNTANRFVKYTIYILITLTPVVCLWGFVSSRLFYASMIWVLFLSILGMKFVEEKVNKKFLIYFIISLSLINFFWFLVSGDFKDFLGN